MKNIKNYQKITKIRQKKPSFLAENEHKFRQGEKEKKKKNVNRNSHIACTLRIYPVATFQLSVFGSLPLSTFPGTNTYIFLS